MAEQTGDKSEKATRHKLRRAREEGQIPRARDFASAVGLLLALKFAFWLMPGWLEDFRRLFTLAYAPLTGTHSVDNALSLLPAATFALTVKMLAPLALVPLTIIAFSMVPGGWVFVVKKLLPNFKALSPLKHFGKLASANHWSEIGKAIAKALVLGFVLYHTAFSTRDAIFAQAGSPLPEMLAHAGNLLLSALMSLAAVFFVFAVIDVPLQVYLFMRQQKMSKQEVKDEYKSTEGRPEIKQRMRQIQRQMAQGALRKQVPGADVVVVNPEHYAVALKYDEKRAEAPFAIAKGVDEMAVYIRTLAREHGIEVVSAPPLARAIYHTTQVNQQIPAPLYRAVAQVLTYVLQLKAFRDGRRERAPRLGTLAVPARMADPEVTP